MKQSKLFSLIKHLPEKELADSLTLLQQHKRKSLKALYVVLSKAGHEEEPEASLVYKAVFGKKYSKASDYLLRNEYRLLYEWLQQYIHQQISTERNFDTAALLGYFLNLGAVELFEEEYNLAWKKALQQDDIDLLTQLSDLNLQYYLTAKNQSLANAEMITQLSQQRINLLQTQFLRSIRKEEIRIKLSERIVSAYKKLEQPLATLNNINLEELEKEDLYAQYLSKRAKINFARGEEKIRLLKNILAQEQVIRKYEPAPEEALCRFLINLAQEYYLNLNFKEAVGYYQKAYEYFEQAAMSVRETLLINYIMSLMRNEDFKLAEKLAAENSDMMLQSKLLASRSPFLLAVLKLHERDAAAAEKYVNLDNKKEGSEFYYFMRLILSAVYYLRGDIEFAVREAINLDQAVNYELNREQNLQTKISKPIVSVFRKFYSTIQSTTKHQLKEELAVLNQEINASLVSANDQSPNSILTQWINKEVSILMSKK